MARKRQRDRQVHRGTPAPPAETTSGTPGAGAPTTGPENDPPAAGASTSVSGLLAAADALATRATPEAVASMRSELIRTLAKALELATGEGNVDQMLKVTDRLTKLLPAERAASVSPNTPDPAEGGGPGGPDDTGAPSAAERFRLVSGELGD